MTTITRMYETEQDAMAAVDALDAAGFLADEVSILTPADNDEAVEAAVRNGFLRAGSLTEVCYSGLRNGRSVVSVKAQFGRGQGASNALQAGGPVDTDLIPEYVSEDAAPFSDLIGMPVLTDSRSSSELVSSSYHALPNFFGMGLLSRRATPLSSMFGMRTLSKPKGPRKRSFGLPLLSSNPAPLSSMFRIPTLTRSGGPGNKSFGFRLLSSNPAPLSRILGIRPLTRRKRG